MPVTMLAVSIMSLAPTGMPSIAESGLSAHQRFADASAAARAAVASITVKARQPPPTRRSISARHSSSTCAGESAQVAKEVVRLTKGRR
jgi:hypothetical protein